MSSTISIKTKLVIDFLVAGLVVVLLSTALTGLALHEWLGIAIGVALVVHLLMGWKWIASITQRFLHTLPGQTRVTYVLDLLLFVCMILTIYSGLMISRVALPALGLNGGAPSFLWRGLHSLAAHSLLALVGLHLAVSWSWIVKNVGKYILEPLRLRSGQSSPTATS